jgi:hypothetical protein
MQLQPAIKQALLKFASRGNCITTCQARSRQIQPLPGALEDCGTKKAQAESCGPTAVPQESQKRDCKAIALPHLVQYWPRAPSGGGGALAYSN